MIVHLDQVFRGLTLGQRRTMALLMKGMSNKEAAIALKISPRTVEDHRYEALRILGVKTLHEAVLRALQIENIEFSPGIFQRASPPRRSHEDEPE